MSQASSRHQSADAGRMPAPVQDISITAEGSMRLDAFLAQQSPIKSRVHAQRMIEDGCVRVNKKRVRKSSHVVKEGDVLQVTIPEIIQSAAAVTGRDVSRITLDVLYEDDDCMIINKPAGLAVHRGSGMAHEDVTLIDVLHAHFVHHALPFHESEILVHRLDKETTGCLLIAKHPRAHARLQKLFEKREIKKTYVALVAGVPSSASALIDAPIGRHHLQRTKMSISNVGRSRAAKTSYTVLASHRGASLLSCDLLTGRTHQIRVHLTSIGHPILGDQKYFSTSSKKLSDELGIDFLCLHARSLRFTSPISKKVIAVTAAIPQQFSQLLLMLDMLNE